MISGTPAQHNAELDSVAAAWIFEQLAVAEGHQVDRSRIRRAVDEAMSEEEWEDGEWWRWMTEAARSIGRKCRVVDGTPEQLARMAREGACVVVRCGEGEAWHSLRRGRRGRLLVGTPRGDKPEQQISRMKLVRLLKLEGISGPVRAIIVEPGVLGAAPGDPAGPKMSPLGRLVSLLQPERSDVMVVVVYALISGVLSLATPLAVESLVNNVAFGRFVQPIIVLALMLFAFLLFQGAMKALSTIVVEIIQRRLFARVASDLSYRLPRTRKDKLNGEHAPELVNRFFDVVTVQKVGAQMLLEGISLVLSTLIGMVVLAFYHPILLGFDFVLVGALVFTVYILGRGAVATSVKESKTKYKMASWLEDLAGCSLTFRMRGAPEFALERADRLTYDYLAARRKHFRVLMRQILFLLSIQALASTAILGLGGWLVISRELSLGQLVAAELIVTAVVGSFAKFGKLMESFYDLLASVDKLGVLFDLPMERDDGALSVPRGSGAEISARDVSYHYPGTGNGLAPASFRLLPGQSMAVVGPAGSGKSTLADLLFGLVAPSGGRLAIHGMDPRDMRPDVLRARVGLLRHPEFFGGTVAENIHLERPEVTTQDVREILRVIGISDLIQALPNGLDTPMNPSGSPLSSRQQALLTAARVLVGRPDVLVIDGTLDAFDESEATTLLRQFRGYLPDATILVMTGHQSLTNAADRTLALEAPVAVAEDGSDSPPAS